MKPILSKKRPGFKNTTQNRWCKILIKTIVKTIIKKTVKNVLALFFVINAVIAVITNSVLHFINTTFIL